MKNRRIWGMLASLILIIGLAGIAVYNNQRFNEVERTLTFDETILKDTIADQNISVKISPRGYGTKDVSSWYHTYHLKGNGAEHHAVGTIYELVITNLTSNVVADWQMNLAMPQDTMFNSGWNGVFELHQNVAGDEKVYNFENAKNNMDDISLDYIFDNAVLLIPMQQGDYFTYYPSEDSNEVPIDGSGIGRDQISDKTIGFITYTENERTSHAMVFADGVLTYRMSRKLSHEPLFWLVCILSWIWMVAFVTMIAVALKMRKVEKEQQVAKSLIHKFERDDLSQTLTRQAFFHYAGQLIEGADKKYAAAIVEVDNYKIMQNQHGEKICNEFLLYLADYLTGLFPEGYIGRFSRSRYAVLFEMKDDEAFDMEKMIAPEMLATSPMPNQVLKLGVYAPVDNTVSIRRCFDRVSLAMSEIRGIYGQNVAYYDDELENQLLDNHMIEQYMEEALEQKQFEVYYQPKHDTESKELIGAEALVRWIHPKYGFMSPGKFIPIFEHTGFITKVDAYVFDTVCRDLKEWEEKGLKRVPVSINASRKDFFEEDWIDKRLELVKELQVDTSLIHVEVTESLYAEDAKVIQKKVDVLKEHGIKIEMDDFGSGYSSLGMLTSLSIDVLKLDISFVKAIEATEVVVETIISLAHKLGLSVIAEGVETEKQYDVVKKHGCDVIQGYYFAKPLPKNDFEKYMKE